MSELGLGTSRNSISPGREIDSTVSASGVGDDVLEGVELEAVVSLGSVSVGSVVEPVVLEVHAAKTSGRTAALAIANIR